MTSRPTLTIDCDQGRRGSECVGVHNLNPGLATWLRGSPQARRLLQAAFTVRVADSEATTQQELPSILGEYEVLEHAVRFVPRFPFEPGVSYRASFDTRQFGLPAEALALEFTLSSEASATPTEVSDVFPSDDSLPENLLRFYVRFSSSMRRGLAAEQITILGADRQPVPDVLYRPPVELWDRGMRCLTVLLDPGRLKRGVGPNRQLGPPLKAGLEYTLVVGSGMMDLWGRPLRQAYCKPFRVTEPVREPIPVGQWTVVAPETWSHQPLRLLFPRPLDWAILWEAITVTSEGEQLIDGQADVDQGERQWSYTPTTPWAPGLYNVRVARGLEDVCGNSPTQAFDRPLRSRGESAEGPHHSIRFRLT